MIECQICKNNVEKIKKRNCNKICNKQNPICKDCFDKVIFDGCPFCKENIYYPNPNKENYYKNLGMKFEFNSMMLHIFENDEELLKRLNLYVQRCIVFDITMQYIHKNPKIDNNLHKSIEMMINCSCDKHKFILLNQRKKILNDVVKSLSIYLKKTSTECDTKIYYLQGKVNAIEIIQKKFFPADFFDNDILNNH